VESHRRLTPEACMTEASKIAGHSDLEMTGEYTFVTAEQQNELTRRIQPQSPRSGNGMRFASEHELQRELQHPWTSGRRDLPGAIRPEIVLRLREVHIVERVEKLRSKLKRHTLEEGEVLE
jgi:hypothetical protein